MFGLVVAKSPLIKPVTKYIGRRVNKLTLHQETQIAGRYNGANLAIMVIVFRVSRAGWNAETPNDLTWNDKLPLFSLDNILYPWIYYRYFLM